MTAQQVDRMVVDVRGEGDAVVFVHGLGGSMNAWTPLLPALSPYRCVRPELPGSGRSSRAYALDEATAHRGQLSIAVLAESVLRVCGVLGIERAHLVGHSLGTIVCQHVAVLAPGLVRSLCLFGAMAEPVPPQREAMRERARVTRAEGMFATAEAISQAALSASSRQDLPVAVAYVRDSIAAQDPEGFARNCIALAEATAAPAEQIRCPVLLVSGDDDIVTPLGGARALAARLADARLEVLSRCGHWPTLERPLQSGRLLRDFLDRIRMESH